MSGTPSGATSQKLSRNTGGYGYRKTRTGGQANFRKLRVRIAKGGAFCFSSISTELLEGIIQRYAGVRAAITGGSIFRRIQPYRPLCGINWRKTDAR